MTLRMRPTDRRRPLSSPVWASLALVAVLHACTCGSDKKTDGQVSTPEGDDQTSSVADPASLAPFLSPVGAEGAVPQQLVLEFARPVVKPEAVNRPAGPKTVLTWEPPVEGTTTFTRPSTLVFVPKNPFKYGARYAVTLSSVETSDGVVTTPAPDAWRFEFSTPPFAFLRVSAQSVDLAKAKVVADVVFAGPVDAGAVRRFLSWRVDGTPVGDVKLGPTDSPNTLRATLVSSKLNASATVELRVKEGLPSSVGGAKADAAGGSFPLFGGEPLSILNAHLKEGPSGFYVEVVCNDPQAEGGKRYYWDAEEDRSHELSRRCELQEAGAQQYIRFQPAVAFSTAPTGHGFRILGDFKRGSLQMKIGAGAGSVDGSVLLTAFEETFNVPARKPQARFAVGGRYLPRKAWKNLPISHLNLSEVELSVRQVPPENLVFWMSNERGERADERTSNLIVKKTVPLRGGPDAQTTSWVDVSSLVPASSQGLFELELKGKGASNAYARLLLTDINLVVKRASAPSGPASGGEVRAWALDMASGKPLSGVDVSLVRPSGQAVARCSTSGDEGCVLTPKADADTTAPFAVVARNGSDLTYLKFDELKAEVTDSDVRGEPYVAEVPYRASVYGDRGVYRPGETAHVTAIVRGKDNRAPPAKLPVTLQLLDPREKVLKRSPLATNEAGMVSHDVAFAGFADTGRYRAQLWVAERQVGEWSFNVEEFVPERMKVGVTLRGAAAPGAESPAEIEAAYLFGGSAAKSPVELTCRIEPAAFRPKENGQYLYGFQAGDGAETPKTITLGQVKGVLDEKGRAHLACPSAAAGGVPGALVASAAVFEAGSGRSTQNEGRAPFHPERFYLGLLTGTQKASANKAFTVEGLVVDWNGSLLPSAVQQVKVELFRLETEYGYFWDEGEGQERYQHHLRPVPEGVSTVAVKNGKFQVSATPAQSGEGYMVRVTAGNARTELRLKGEYSGHWYDEGGEGAVDRTPRPLKPKPVALQVPSLAKVGEAVDVKVKVPFAGYLLMTAETDRLLKSEWRKVSAGESAWSFTVPEFIPNAYVSAFLVKDPHLESAEAFIPDRAFGVASIPFEPTAFTRAVKLEAPDEVRSNAPLAVTLDLGKLDEPTYATVAVVDEGILSLTRFKSPEPFDALFAKRALGVDTFETVGWAMLLPPQGAAKNSGGDGSDGMASRVQPVKPVALWSGTVKVPESGKVTIPFKMPQYRGAVRVMAVTAGPNRIGRASKRVTVRDPLVLQTTLPRFLVQGDQVQIPVFLTNTSGSRQEVRVSLTAE
ncbi:MAG TPA: MG2 domain-containing protein, partial [Myxococcaceae bacterium]|nr:MG2 domain-containing protein [Myxococcaceae bacterium]